MRNRDESMSGKICMVTGATSGIGAATALSLARLGATVIVVGRNPEKCARTIAQIERDTGNASVGYMVADLSIQHQIHALADLFKGKYPRLDVLINNAGGRFLSWSNHTAAYEMTFALNHLGYFVLTNLLLPELLTSSHGRSFCERRRRH